MTAAQVAAQMAVEAATFQKSRCELQSNSLTADSVYVLKCL